MNQELKQYKRIILLGDGWGAIAVYKGLTDFCLPVFVQTNDEELRSMANQEISYPLSQYSGELLLFAGYKPIVSKDVLGKNTCINVHYSLLPAYRGFHSTVWAILNNEKYLGLSIHLMDEFIDNGPIIHQYKVENDYVRTSAEYMQHFNFYIEQNISSIIVAFVEGKLKPEKQDKLFASWVGKRHEEDCKIDFTKPIAYQKAFFRALVKPYPLPFITYEGEKYIVSKVKFQKSSIVTQLGRILNVDNDGVWVQIADGYMIIEDVQNITGEKILNNFKVGVYL